MLGVDTETNGEDIRTEQGFAMGVGVAYIDVDGYHNMYFPIRHEGPGNLPPSILPELKITIESAPSVVFHNAKFDLVSLRTLGIDYFGRDWFCTMVIAHLINENWPRSKSLNACCLAYLGEEFQKKKTPALDAVIKAFGWAKVPVVLISEYGGYDAELALRLMGALYEKFKGEGLDKYWPYKRRLIETVALKMEQRGVSIDTNLCEQQLYRADIEMTKHSQLLGGLNPRSPRDMKTLLIDTLHLPPLYHPKTGNVTFDKMAMAQYEEMLNRLNSPIANHILSYRGWGHASANFYRAYLNNLSPDGFLRPHYTHHKDESEGGTITGRLSCRDPNLQQIPRISNKPWNGAVKQVFKPRPGYKLWEGDFSQLELRLGAAYAQEQNMLTIFNARGQDIFSAMAEAMGMARHDVKTLTYSMQYGAGINRIMNVFGVTETRAREIRNNYFDTYPNLKILSEMAQAKAKSQRYSRLWSGRRRHYINVEKEAHKALNSIIQGGAADIVERRMIDLGEQLDDGENFRMLLQVHDSVIAEVKIGQEEEVLSEWRRTMEAVEPDFGVHFAVDVHRFGD